LTEPYVAQIPNKTMHAVEHFAQITLQVNGRDSRLLTMRLSSVIAL